MSNIALAMPPLVYVQWGCRRCGHQGGIARTTVPLDTTWTEGMGRTLFDQLRLKLVRVHQKSGCIATPSDFTFRGITAPPPGKHLIGQV